ncbi:hypothetical protein STSP2_03368 [Anaerohalosphaera lusitana]|uniref:Uncharacterized protein n=1 Tax=Anaerohalosphaera lusitana TaxID=1936003 RepID=A0A1U9NQF3_9BACT|nr:hypothetical protein [Anaerohalosphaera lusitana]AQT70163.1 hypothetical protein STSP2_03368 [Anaerohalosphaera lusitana]
MKKRILAILVCAAGLVSGCGDARQKTVSNGKLLEGVTLDAIKPSAPAVPDTKQHHFAVHIIELPAENFPALTTAYDSLTKGRLKHTNENIFNSNGFAVHRADIKQWSQAAQILENAHARSRISRNIILPEQDGHDIRIASSRRPQRVSYVDLTASSVRKTLDPGEIAWRMHARGTDQRGQALVSMEAVFKHFDSAKLRTPGKDPKEDDLVFKFSKFRTLINEGEFILLGPARYEAEARNLANMFFTTHADFIVPAEDSEKNPQDGPIIKRSHIIKKNIPIIKLYLIRCERVEN